MAKISVDSSLALLHVNGIVREIPMHEAMAVVVEVQPFLSDGG